MTQGYGENVAYYAQQGYAGGHPGIDWGLPSGTPVLACESGVVAFAGVDGAYPGRGCHVWVDHGNGFRTVYMHLDHAEVAAGQVVGARQLIGSSDNTGLTSGPHLHLGVEQASLVGDGMRGFIDPAPMIVFT